MGHLEKQQVPRSESDQGLSVDGIVVDWDGPNDPANPKNWSGQSRYAHVLVASALTLIVYVMMTYFSQSTPP